MAKVSLKPLNSTKYIAEFDTYHFKDLEPCFSVVVSGGDGTQEEAQEEPLSFTVRTTEGQVSLKDLILPPPAASTNSLLRSSPDSEERASVKGYVCKTLPLP